MQKGTVKWFNPTKGYGFIKPTTGEKDVFVHISAVERAGLRSLDEGQEFEVEVEVVTNRGKTSAENLKVAQDGGHGLRFARRACCGAREGQRPVEMRGAHPDCEGAVRRSTNRANRSAQID